MVKNLLRKIELNKEWYEVDLGDYNDFYLIAIKDTKLNKKDTIFAGDVDTLEFEIGIDSGVAGKPLTIGYIKLYFNETSSTDEEFNKISAFVRVLNQPNKFFIRVVSITKGNETITEGTTSISVNLNSVNLG